MNFLLDKMEKIKRPNIVQLVLRYNCVLPNVISELIKLKLVFGSIIKNKKKNWDLIQEWYIHEEAPFEEHVKDPTLEKKIKGFIMFIICMSYSSHYQLLLRWNSILCNMVSKPMMPNGHLIQKQKLESDLRMVNPWGYHIDKT